MFLKDNPDLAQEIDQKLRVALKLVGANGADGGSKVDPIQI